MEKHVVCTKNEADEPEKFDIFEEPKVKITWIGHSTFLLQGDGISVLTDPWFGRSLMMRRVRQPALTPEEISACTVVLVSHGHEDHWDVQGMELARRLGSMVVAPPSVAQKASKKGLLVTPSEAGKNLSVRGVNIEPVPAYHPAPGIKDAVGYMFQLGGRRIYFAGDTLFTSELQDVLTAYQIDVAMLPIGVFKLFGKKLVMDSNDAVKMAQAIKPRYFIPMHYGFLKGTKAQPELLSVLQKSGIKVCFSTPGVPFLI